MWAINNKIKASCRTKEEANETITKWFHRGKGTSEAYDFFRVKGEHKLWNNCIWKPFIPPKQAFCAWMAFRGRLATRDRLRRFITDLSCPLCHVENESCKHLFFECRITAQVWNPIKTWLGIERRSSTLLSSIKWCENKRGGSSIKRKAMKTALVASIYYIWAGRNQLTFEAKAFTPAAIIHMIKTHTYSMMYTCFPPEKVIQHLPN